MLSDIETEDILFKDDEDDQDIIPADTKKNEEKKDSTILKEEQIDYRKKADDLEKIRAKTNQTMVGFVAPAAVAGFSLLDYLLAADFLMNVEYRISKLM